MGVPLTLSSVPALTPYIQYVATSSQTVFPYPFPITQDSDLVCVANGVTLGTDSGYTLSGQGQALGGNLTFSVGRTAGDIITLFRNVAIQRITQIGQNSGYSSITLNAEFNNVYLIMQQLQESIALCLQVPNTNNPAPVTTLVPANYANKYLSFDSSGNPTPAALTSSGTITGSLILSLLSAAGIGGVLYGGQNAIELAAGVMPTNTAYPYGDLRRYSTGTTGNGVADDTTVFNNWIAAIKGNTGYMPAPAVSYTIPNGLTISGHTNTQIRSDTTAKIVVSTGTANATLGINFALTLNNCVTCDFNFGTLSFACAGGAIFTSSSAGTTNTKLYFNQLLGPGRSGSKPGTPVSGSIGVCVLGPAGGLANYYHTIGVNYAFGADCIFAAHTPAGGTMNANQNIFYGQIAGYWYGGYTNSVENEFNLRCDNAAGIGASLTVGVQIGDGTYASNFNFVHGVMEPSGTCQAANLLANSLNNWIQIQDNCDHAITDAGTNNVLGHNYWLMNAAMTLKGGLTLPAPSPAADTATITAAAGKVALQVNAAAAGSTAMRAVGQAAGTPAFAFNTMTQTGAGTITLTLTGYPGTNTGAKAVAYLPLTLDGSKYWALVVPD